MPTYRIYDFLKTNNISISPEIQNRAVYPFTMGCAQRFFDKFIDKSFYINVSVASIIILDGKENFPKHSYAHGFLFSQSLDEIGSRSSMPMPVGRIEFEYDGKTISPTIHVVEYDTK